MQALQDTLAALRQASDKLGRIARRGTGGAVVPSRLSGRHDLCSSRHIEAAKAQIEAERLMVNHLNIKLGNQRKRAALAKGE